MDNISAYYPPHDPYITYYQHPPPPQSSLPPPPPGSLTLHPTPSLAPLPHHHHHLAHYPYVPPQPTPIASYAPTYASDASRNEVRTLFVAGMPEDVKPREIYNLFREFSGYESSRLRSPTEDSQPFAFAVFSNQQSAIAAMHALNGMVFDLEKGSTLYVDLAKSNSRSKRSRTEDEWPDTSKKARGSLSRSLPDSGFGSIHLPGMSNSAYNTIGYPSTQSHGHFARAGNEIAAMDSKKYSSPRGSEKAPPCPTLFVANLGPSSTEQELIQVFSRCSGFLKLKMQSTYGAPVAFVDFKDTACSTGALNSLQGTILYSSTGGEGMRLEYAKSRMGMRRKGK